MTTKVTISNEPNDTGRDVKVTVSTYGSDTVRIVPPGETIKEYVYDYRSILVEEGDVSEETPSEA